MFKFYKYERVLKLLFYLKDQRKEGSLLFCIESFLSFFVHYCLIEGEDINGFSKTFFNWSGCNLIAQVHLYTILEGVKAQFLLTSIDTK